MNVFRIDHISLVVGNTDASLRFYRDLLGLSVAGRRELGFPGAWLQVGEQQIHLLEVPNVDPVNGRPSHGGRDRHIAMVVDNIDEFTARLEQAGVEVSRSRSGRRALFCRDPDGNGIELIEIAR